MTRALHPTPSADLMLPTESERLLAEDMIAHSTLDDAETTTCVLIVLAARAGSPVLASTLEAFLAIARRHARI